MEIREVTIGGFGAISGERIELAPGMTVVYGPNESAKSTLHAATYAALCGMRRARGMPRREDAYFIAQHKPWDGGPWQVSAKVALADGRLIEITHDLAGGVDCRATDTALARDVSNEIMSDGAPDASRWLGFDRGSFVATACVRQGEIAAVLASADGLQDEIQRAAASAGRDETAAEAIQRLRAFLAEQVGQDRRNSPRPLRRAIETEAEAQRLLAEAQARHEDYLQALAALGEAERERDGTATRLRIAEALVARADEAAAQQHAKRASELAAKYPEEPAGLSGEEELSKHVAEALAVWDACPPEPDLSGPSVEELEAELAKMPEAPVGDLSPAQDVMDAEAALRTTEQVLDSHDKARPDAVDGEALPKGTSPAELRDLAEGLAVSTPTVDPSLQKRVAELRGRISPAKRSRVPLGVAVTLAIGGVLALAFGATLVGLLLFISAVGLSVGVFWLRRQQPEAAAAAALKAAEDALEQQQQGAAKAGERRAAALARLEELGLEADPAALRGAAELLQASAEAVQRLEVWNGRRAKLVANCETAREALRSVLRHHGEDPGADLDAALASYKSGCGSRSEQDRAASRRHELAQRLSSRQVAEADLRKRKDARTQLSEVARRVEFGEGDPVEIAAKLRSWQEERAALLEQHDAGSAEWKELQMLLDGRTLPQVIEHAEEFARRANTAAQGVDADDLSEQDSEAAKQALPRLRSDVAELAERAASAAGQVEEMEKGLPSVAAAEEALASAEAELDRVRSLETTLGLAIDFLTDAQDRVHRTIAPVLCNTLREWLPRVAVERQGDSLVERYDDARVDPESLRVDVRLGSGPWRDASFVSEGTKEQIFLLLRVALAKHLTNPGETAPLVLDEVTAQCDPDRRVALLELLHELSADRQVVLFTHDEGVYEWAQTELSPPRDRLDTRDPVPRLPQPAAVTA